MKSDLKKLKVITVVGTRPELIRLSRVINELDRHCDHILVHTGQNYDYELNQIFFEDLSIRRPDFFLDAACETAAQTIGKIIAKMDEVLLEQTPDALLVLGDTNSCLAVISAKRRKIPTFHMEAGNRCFDMRVPEEINRKIVDHTSDINMPYSSIARDYLLAEGLPPQLIIKTGSPMNEVLCHYEGSINGSKILETLELEKNKFFLVSAHREENIASDKNFFRLVDVLNSIADKFELPVIVSTHPRTLNRIKETQVQFKSNVDLLKPLGFSDYNKLQKNATVVLSDSGTITEESSIMNFPALNIRESHERPEGMEEAAVMMVGLDTERVMQGIEILSTQGRAGNRDLEFVRDYQASNVSKKIVRIIHSYTDYVNQAIWKKY